MITPNLQTNSANFSLFKKELIVEIELNGKMKFDQILNSIYMQMGMCYKVLSANIEYIKGSDFGTFQLHILANTEEIKQLELFLDKNKLLHNTIEYHCRKYS